MPSKLTHRILCNLLTRKLPIHSACRARSRRDFISKVGIVVEESDESVFWLNFVKRAEMKDTPEGTELMNEAKELLAIFTKSAKTASASRQ